VSASQYMARLEILCAAPVWCARRCYKALAPHESFTQPQLRARQLTELQLRREEDCAHSAQRMFAPQAEQRRSLCAAARSSMIYALLRAAHTFYGAAMRESYAHYTTPHFARCRRLLVCIVCATDKTCSASYAQS